MLTAPNETKLFLARAVAWPQDGDPVAYVNIHRMFALPDPSKEKKDARGRTLWNVTGNAFTDLSAADNHVSWFKNQQSTKDIYFCTSTQMFAKKDVTTKGKPTLRAQRHAEHAVKMKCLFVDCDLSDGKADKDDGYATKEDFAAAFKNFLQKTGLPRPTMMVFTGGGFHIYWALVEAMTIEQWMPLAFALAEATRREGLKCDTQCTTDAARILRVPGTTNFKYDPPRKVTMLGNPLDHDYMNSKIEKILEPYKVAVPHSITSSTMTLFPPRQAIEGLSELASGIDTSSHAPVKLDSLVLECGFVADALATGGANFQNPLWNLTTLISTFTEGGLTDAHRMASGHSGYNPHETEELFERKTAEKLNRDMGWPRCAAIKQAGCNSCAVCPHFTENKSPLNFGQRAVLAGLQVNPNASFTVPAAPAPVNSTASAQVTSPGTAAQQHAVTAQVAALLPGVATQDPDLPDNYLRSPTGLILHPVNNEDGTTTYLPVSRYPMVNPWLQKNPWTLNFTTETEHGVRSTISIETKDVGSAELKKALQEQGFMVTNGIKGLYTVSEFIMAWITKLQETKNSVISSVPFGWLVRQGKTEGFVYGGELHTPTGTEVASNTDPELGRQFAPEGDRLPWLDAANMITNQNRPELNAILASAFGAPLVRFTGHAGLLLSAYSQESGIGKSTALKVAQAVWGDPIKAVQSLSDTQNSVLNKMGELRSLPMYWDELKSEEDTKKFVDTVFRLTLGKEKSRMTSKVTQRTPGTWQTIMVAASNESLMDSIAYKTRATTAGIYRVFEYTVTKPLPGAPGQIDPTVAQRVLSKLHDNYGCIGLEYASYLGSNHVQIEADMALMLETISKEIQMQPDERFWVGLIACLMMGAKYSNQLGYTAIDELALKAFLYRTLQDMRNQRRSQPVDMRDVSNVVNVLARFLSEARARNTVTTSIIWKGQTKAPTGTVLLIGDHTRIDGVKVHLGVTDKTLRIGQQYLADWLGDNNYPRHVFMEAVRKELGASQIKGRLGAGTTYANATEYLLEIDLNGSPLESLVNEL